MALEYQKDGKTVRCEAVHHRGRVRQIVILDYVDYGKNSIHPLANYPMHSVFTVVRKLPLFPEDQDEYYKLRDTNGNFIIDHALYLFDLVEWIAWQTSYNKEKLQRKDHKIELQQAQIDILKSAVGGIRVITEDQLKALGK